MSKHLQLFEPGFPEPFETAFRRFLSPARLWTEEPAMEMRLDISERDDAYLVKADLPGVKKEDISVRIDGNVVQIDAECRQEKETKAESGKVLRSERYYGALSRTFSLGHDVDDAKVDATYADGVLTLRLPKKAESAAKRIAVH